MTNLEVAKDIILTYLNKGMSSDGFYDIFEIKNGNKNVLLEHLKALKNIFEKAIKELGGNEE